MEMLLKADGETCCSGRVIKEQKSSRWSLRCGQSGAASVVIAGTNSADLSQIAP